MYKLAWTYYKQQRYETSVRQFIDLLRYSDEQEKLTGDPGTGKTSLLHRLIADNRDAYSIGFLSNARYDVEYLLPWILLALGLNTKQLDPVEAQHLFAKFLAEQAIRKRRVVLIMDEATSALDNVTEREVMEAVRAHFEAAGMARQKWPEQLVQVDDFPRTASGKVQKYRVRQAVAAG